MSSFALLASALAAIAGQDAVPQWPQFRGPGGTAVADDTPIPTAFGPDSQVLWRTDLPTGHSSPCVWGDRVFVTGFEAGRNVVLGLDRATGAIVWRRSFAGEPHPEYSHVDAVPALPTTCTDGEHVVAYFGNFGLVTLDLDGQVLWEKRLSHPGYGFGVGPSPILADGKVILSRDGAPEAATIAYDVTDGSEVWQIDRLEFVEAHATPFVWSNADRSELVLGGTGQVCGFDLETGAPLWSVGGVTIFVCTTPTADADMLYFAAWSTPNATGRSLWEAGFGRSLEITDAEIADPSLLFERLDADGNGLVDLDEVPESRGKDAFTFIDRNGDGIWDAEEFAGADRQGAAPGKNLMVAVGRGGEGDVTESHVAWTWSRGLPYVASPLLYRGRVWLFKAGGIVTCLDATTGEPIVNRERLPDRSEYYVSPVGAAGHVIAGSAEGTLFLLDADAPGLEIVHSVDLGEELFATPAVVEGKVYLRTRTTLWAFGD